jgi:hypothetical protein
MQILAAAFLLTCMPTALLDFAIPKWKAEEAFTIQDAYKYLFQATMGGEHAALERDIALARLEKEWSEMGDTPAGENEWEPLCPSGEIGRVNLRPFKRGGGKQGGLIDAFLASSREFRPDKDRFLAAWAELGRRLEKDKIGKLDQKAWQKFDAEMKERGYPAVSHSDEYRKAKRPAYRVITLEQVQLLIAS